VACRIDPLESRFPVTESPLELIPLTPALAFVQGGNQGRFPSANALLVQDGGVTALIDTGCGEPVLRALLAERPIDFVICTHSHIDHISGNWLMQGLPIWMPAGIAFETAGSAARLAVRFADDPNIQQRWLATSVPYVGYRDAPPTDAYPPGHVFEVGRVKLHSIPAPGHVTDHTCFWEPESGTLLATDIDFTGFGPWYGNPESDPTQFEESIRRVWALNPRTVISSHKGIFRDDLDRQFEVYLGHFARRERAILAALENPRSLAALTDLAIVYGRFPRAEDMLRYFEREMIAKHLARLARQGRVRQLEPGLWQAVEGKGAVA